MSVPHPNVPPEFIKRGQPATFTAADLMALQLPPVKWVVPDLLPEGVALLAAKPKMGKSWLALGLAVAIAHGGVALGSRRVEQGEVLYMALEDNQRRLQKRLTALLTDGAPGALHMTTDWPQIDDGGDEALEEWLQNHPKARLIVVDILKKVRPRASANRSVYEADYEALEALQRLAGEYGVAIVVIHHLRKMSASDPLDELSGSTGLTGGADSILVMKRDRGRADAYLTVTGREIEEEAELALKWDANLVSWTLAGDADEYRRSEEQGAILRTLRETGEPMTPKEVAEALDRNASTTRTLLRKMATSGLVQARNGHYACVDRVDSVDATPALGAPESTESVESTGLYGSPNGGRRLTTGETEEVKRLIRQGMAPGLARAEVLGEAVLP